MQFKYSIIYRCTLIQYIAKVVIKQIFKLFNCSKNTYLQKIPKGTTYITNISHGISFIYTYVFRYSANATAQYI